MTVSKLEGLHFDEIYLIINKVSVEMVKSGEMMSVDDVINIVAVPLIGAIPDEKDVIHSNNIGKPVILKSRSRAGMAYANIAKRLTGIKVPILADEKKRFFGFRRK